MHNKYWFLILIMNISFLFCVNLSNSEVRISSAHTPSSSLVGNGTIDVGSIDYIQNDLYIKKDGSQCSDNKYMPIVGTGTRKKKICFNKHEIIKYYRDTKEFANFYGSSGILLDSEIKDYFRRALINELKFIGYKVSRKSDYIINGTVRKFLFDTSKTKNGKMIVKFDFEISDKKNGENILKDSVSGEFIFGSLYPDMSGRTVDYTSTVYTATSRAIEELVNKSQAAGVLEYE